VLCWVVVAGRFASSSVVGWSDLGQNGLKWVEICTPPAPSRWLSRQHRVHLGYFRDTREPMASVLGMAVVVVASSVGGGQPAIGGYSGGFCDLSSSPRWQAVIGGET
jgi:hypothetical protein